MIQYSLPLHVIAKHLQGIQIADKDKTMRTWKSRNGSGRAGNAYAKAQAPKLSFRENGNPGEHQPKRQRQRL